MIYLLLNNWPPNTIPRINSSSKQTTVMEWRKLPLGSLQGMLDTFYFTTRKIWTHHPPAGSNQPANPKKTVRVMAIKLSEEANPLSKIIIIFYFKGW